MTNVYTAIRTNEGVPAWDLKDNRSDFVIGFMTDFPGEGPTATVRLNQGENGVTVKSKSLHTCLLRAREAYEELYDEYETRQLVHIEDEDGSIAYGKMLERQAEDHAMRYEFDEPCW